MTSRWRTCCGGEPIREVSREGGWGGLRVVPGNNNISKAVVMLAGEHGREMGRREALDPVRDDYGLILIDCAPSLELLTVNALAAADRALVVTTPGKFSLDGMSELEKSVASVVRYYNPLLTVAGVGRSGPRHPDPPGVVRGPRGILALAHHPSLDPVLAERACGATSRRPSQPTTTPTWRADLWQDDPNAGGVPWGQLTRSRRGRTPPRRSNHGSGRARGAVA